MQLTASAVFRPRSSMGQFVASRITPGVRAGVSAASDLVVDEAKALCPVLTGELRDSIHAEIAETEKTVVGTIIADEDYAGYVEFGTGRRGMESPGAGAGPYNENWPGMVAQPYMRPALDTTRETVRELMRSEIALGLNK